MRFRLFVAIFSAMALPGSPQAEPVPLAGEALNATVAGATIHFRSPIGTIVPVVYGGDGRMMGRAGAVSWYLGSATDSGRWWVTGHQLCHKWTIWFDAAARCLTLKRSGRMLHWSSDDNDHGSASIEVAAPVLAAIEPPKTAASDKASGVSEPAAAEKPLSPAEVLARRPLVMATTVPRVTAAAASAGRHAFSENAFNPAASRSTARTPLPRAQTPAETATTATTATTAAPKSAAPAASAPGPKPAETAKAAAQPAPLQQPVAVARPQEPPPQWSNTYRVAGVTLDDVLWVRKGPSSLHEAVGSISPRGRGVRVVGPCFGDWCPVAHRGVRGWVNRYFLAADLAPGARRAY